MPDDGYLIDTPTARRLDRVLRRAQNKGNRTEDPDADTTDQQETCWGKLTASVDAEAGTWEWLEVHRKADGTWQAKSTGRDGDNDRDDPYKTLAVELVLGMATADTVYLLRRLQVKQEDSTWQTQWMIVAAAGDSVKWGVLAAAWAPGDTTVTLTPSDSAGTIADPAPDDIEVKVYASNSVPLGFGEDEGAVLPYLEPVEGDRFLISFRPFISDGADQYTYLGNTSSGGMNFVPLVIKAI